MECLAIGSLANSGSSWRSIWLICVRLVVGQAGGGSGWWWPWLVVGLAGGGPGWWSVWQLDFLADRGSGNWLSVW